MNNIICQCCGDVLPLPKNEKELEFQLGWGCGATLSNHYEDHINEQS